MVRQDMHPLELNIAIEWIINMIASEGNAVILVIYSAKTGIAGTSNQTRGVNLVVESSSIHLT